MAYKNVYMKKYALENKTFLNISEEKGVRDINVRKVHDEAYI